EGLGSRLFPGGDQRGDQRPHRRWRRRYRRGRPRGAAAPGKRARRGDGVWPEQARDQRRREPPDPARARCPLPDNRKHQHERPQQPLPRHLHPELPDGPPG
ncbi:unnamed protein product, partial [Ectocarpus sp. 12 AP-2014]